LNEFIMPKRLKDPNQPKKPLTGYFRYLADHRKIVKAENPDLKPPQLTKKCGALWRGLDPEKKKEYVDAAAADTTVWRVKMAAYKKTPEFEAFDEKRKAADHEIKIKRRKTPKDKNAPKKPQTAFFLYSGVVRESVKLTLPEGDRRKVVLITKKIGKMWKALTEEEKTSWKSKADKLKEKYKEVYEEYKKTDNYASYMEVLTTFKEEQRERMKEAKNKKKVVVKKPKKVAVQKRQIESDSSDSESTEERRPVVAKSKNVVMESQEDTEEESSDESS